MSFFQTEYRQGMDVSYPGKAIEIRSAKPFMDVAAHKLQTVLLEVGDVVGDGDVTFTLSLVGVGSVSYTADANPTQTEVIDGLLAAIYESEHIGRAFSASKTSNPDEILLTGRFYGIEYVTTFTGGANTAQTNSAGSISPAIPFGRVLVTKSTYPSVDGIPSASLPTDSGDVEVGFGIASKSYEQIGQWPNVESGYQSEDPMDALDDGVVWVLSETDFAMGDPIYYRHTADGLLNQIGAIANAPGTGLRAIANLTCKVVRPTETLYDGTKITMIDVR